MALASCPGQWWWTSWCYGLSRGSGLRMPNALAQLFGHACSLGHSCHDAHPEERLRLRDYLTVSLTVSHCFLACQRSGRANHPIQGSGRSSGGCCASTGQIESDLVSLSHRAFTSVAMRPQRAFWDKDRAAWATLWQVSVRLSRCSSWFLSCVRTWRQGPVVRFLGLGSYGRGPCCRQTEIVEMT